MSQGNKEITVAMTKPETADRMSAEDAEKLTFAIREGLASQQTVNSRLVDLFDEVDALLDAHRGAAERGEELPFPDQTAESLERIAELLGHDDFIVHALQVDEQDGLRQMIGAGSTSDDPTMFNEYMSSRLGELATWAAEWGNGDIAAWAESQVATIAESGDQK
ncbi:MAG: hypothetical protein NTX33_19885 [Propionibacteriales bacterium]|nr:hypothetical protein [Propionibacteriales bacterium]